MITHLDHLNMTVKNLEETLSWYHQVFDFEKVEEGTYNGKPWAILNAGEVSLCLYEHGNLKTPGERDDLGIHGVNHLSFRVADQKKWETRVRELDLKIHYGGIIEWPHSKSWYLSDPSGYEIEVVLWENGKAEFS